MSEDNPFNRAIENTYQILTGRKTNDELLEEMDVVDLLFYPDEEIKLMDGDIYDVLIELYEEEDNFEKCKEILDIKISLLKKTPSHLCFLHNKRLSLERID